MAEDVEPGRHLIDQFKNSAQDVIPQYDAKLYSKVH